MRVHLKVSTPSLRRTGQCGVAIKGPTQASAKLKQLAATSQVSDALERYVRRGIVPGPIHFGFLKFCGFGVAGAFSCKVFFDLGCFSSGLGFLLGGTLAAAIFRYVLSPFKPLWNRLAGPEARMRRLCPNVQTFDELVKPIAILWYNVTANVERVKGRLEEYKTQIKNHSRETKNQLAREKQRNYSEDLFSDSIARSEGPVTAKNMGDHEDKKPLEDLRDQVIPDIETFFESASQASQIAKKMVIDALTQNVSPADACFQKIVTDLDRLARFDERSLFPRVFAEMGEPGLGV